MFPAITRFAERLNVRNVIVSTFGERHNVIGMQDGFCQTTDTSAGCDPRLSLAASVFANFHHHNSASLLRKVSNLKTLARLYFSTMIHTRTYRNRTIEILGRWEESARSNRYVWMVLDLPLESNHPFYEFNDAYYDATAEIDKWLARFEKRRFP